MTNAIEQSDYALNMEFKRREWVGLTEEEMETLYYGNADTITGTERNFGRAVEALLREKNT
jgi:hypothetical protein